MYLFINIWLIGSITSFPKINWPGLFVYSVGTYFVLQNILWIGWPSMGQNYIHMCILYYMHVQYPLVIYLSFHGCVHVLIPWGIRLSINFKLFFYKDTSKIIAYEFSYSVICDSCCPWILDWPRSLYRVCNPHCFLVVIYRYFGPPYYGVYHYNNFLNIISLPIFISYIGNYEIYT